MIVLYIFIIILQQQILTPDGKSMPERRKGLNVKTPTFLEKYLLKNKDPADKDTYPYNCLKSTTDEKGTTLNSIHPNLSTCSMSEIFKDTKISNNSACNTPGTSCIASSSQLLEEPLLPQIKTGCPEDSISFMIDPR